MRKRGICFLAFVIVFQFSSFCVADNRLSPEEVAFLRLYNETIISLSEGKKPVYELKRVDKKILCDAFVYVFDTGRIDQIENDVFVQSGGKIQMLRVSPEKFGLDFGRGLNIRYYFLTGKEKKYRVVIAPSMGNKPVMFLPLKK